MAVLVNLSHKHNCPPVCFFTLELLKDRYLILFKFLIPSASIMLTNNNLLIEPTTHHLLSSYQKLTHFQNNPVGLNAIISIFMMMENKVKEVRLHVYDWQAPMKAQGT
jgi:hypothetical protein